MRGHAPAGRGVSVILLLKKSKPKQKKVQPWSRTCSRRKTPKEALFINIPTGGEWQCVPDAVERSRPPNWVSGTCSALLCAGGRRGNCVRAGEPHTRGEMPGGSATWTSFCLRTPSPLRLTRARTLCTCRKGLKQRRGSRVSLSPFALSKEAAAPMPGRAPLRAAHFPRHLRQMSPLGTAHGASSRLPLGCGRAPSRHLHRFHHGTSPGHSCPPSCDWPPLNMKGPSRTKSKSRRRTSRKCISCVSPSCASWSLLTSRHKVKMMGVIGGWKILNQREMYGLDDLWITQAPWHKKQKNIYSPWSFYFFKAFLFILFLFLKSSCEMVHAPVWGLIIVSRKRVEGEWVDSLGRESKTKSPRIEKVLDKKAFCDSCTLWNEDLKNIYKPQPDWLESDSSN